MLISCLGLETQAIAYMAQSKEGLKVCFFVEEQANFQLIRHG